jgi:hypothetical protein
MEHIKFVIFNWVLTSWENSNFLYTTTFTLEMDILEHSFLCCLARKFKESRTSETSVTHYQSAQCNISGDLNLQQHHFQVHTS